MYLDRTWMTPNLRMQPLRSSQVNVNLTILESNTISGNAGTGLPARISGPFPLIAARRQTCTRPFTSPFGKLPPEHHWGCPALLEQLSRAWPFKIEIQLYNTKIQI